MKKFLLFLFLLFYLVPVQVFGNEQAIQNGLNFLKTKQDVTGRITTGFSSPSQWSAIAFKGNGVHVTEVKNPTISLYDFLLTDTPLNDAATEWETRILAIVAAGSNPSNFNGVNYVEKLETFYTANQLGDPCSLNDDIFGLLSLIAAGDLVNTQIKQDVLSFLITKQDTTDGGFGFSAPGCAWYSTSADMTGAALHALVSAKNAGMTHAELDNAIEKAKNYLLTNQNSDGGFGYFGSSDTDTTGWVLIGLNAAGMQTSEQAVRAKTYLLSQQSPTDGGFMAFDWVASTFVSNATTTAHALIALSGKTWIIQPYASQTTVLQTTPTPIISPTTIPTPTHTPTPKPGLTSVEQSTVLYQTITITTTPAPKKIFKTTQQSHSKPVTGEILGEIREEKNHAQSSESITKPASKTVTVLGAATQNPAYLFIALGSLCLATIFLLRAVQKTRAGKQNNLIVS